MPKAKARKSKPRRTPVQTAADEIRAISPIKIGPKFFRVSVFSKEKWPWDDDNIGCIHYIEGEIHVKEDPLCPSDMIDTLFHEVIHGTGGLYLYRHKKSSARFTEEEFTGAVEVGLTSLFLDNPKLLALFVKYWNPANRQPSIQGDLK